MNGWLLGRIRVGSAELACQLHRRKSRWYWLVHEIHLVVYWWGREKKRWELNDERRAEAK